MVGGEKKIKNTVPMKDTSRHVIDSLKKLIMSDMKYFRYQQGSKFQTDTIHVPSGFIVPPAFSRFPINTCVMKFPFESHHRISIPITFRVLTHYISSDVFDSLTPLSIFLF